MASWYTLKKQGSSVNYDGFILNCPNFKIRTENFPENFVEDVHKAAAESETTLIPSF